MTAVRNDIRDGGVGEALKWLARQIALEYPISPVEQLSVTFDNLQGRNCHVNFTKLGIICGAAGGAFKKNVYASLTGEQHRGNPTDRFKGRWYLNSPWVIAHLQDKIQTIPLQVARTFPSALTLDKKDEIVENLNLVCPAGVNTELNADYISLPIPFDWDKFLKYDRNRGYRITNEWRVATRIVLHTYYANGYTTILQVPDPERGVNMQVLAKDFDPFQPPVDLLSKQD